MAGTIERDLATLEQGITLLKIDYERFFAGDLKMPPVATRRRIEDVLKKVGNADVERAAERFRLQSIQSRYTALAELWDKRLIAKEQGRRLGARLSPVTAAPEVAPPRGRDVRPSASVKGKGRIDLSPLFERYCAARR